ncbi:hypothetical protein [Sinomonas atrocyanea]
MFHGNHAHRSLTVHVDSARELDSALSSAIGTLQQHAVANPCCGILVTREAAGSTGSPSTRASRSASRSSAAPDRRLTGRAGAAGARRRVAAPAGSVP